MPNKFGRRPFLIFRNYFLYYFEVGRRSRVGALEIFL